ncbi:MAG: hypothetical protein E7372_01490 [Clostridiales bacterium]|nr:hypothetical protein [Clostridiales bacterium]
MKIQEILTITELSRLLNKSRPSTYKYISDYQSGNFENIPPLIKELFDSVENGKFNKGNIYEYCYNFLIVSSKDEIKEIYDLLNENKEKLNLTKIKEYILKEIKDEK